MKAITTKYRGPTNSRGSRVVASDSDGNKVSVPYDHAGSTEDAHRAAAVALAKKMGWSTKLCAGGLKDGYAFVFSDTCKGGGVSGARGRKR